MLADIETNDALPAGELQLCPSESGPLPIFPMSADRRRIVATIEQPQGDAPSLDLVRRILSERAPAGIEARALHWSSYFRIRHRHAAKMGSRPIPSERSDLAPDTLDPAERNCPIATSSVLSQFCEKLFRYGGTYVHGDLAHRDKQLWFLEAHLQG